VGEGTRRGGGTHTRPRCSTPTHHPHPPTPPNPLAPAPQSLASILRKPGVRKKPWLVRSVDDALTAARAMASGALAPIFLTSSVTGAGLDLVRLFYGLLPQRTPWFKAQREPAEMVIDEVFGVPGVGTVVAGTIKRGVLTAATPLLLGPDIGDGTFKVGLCPPGGERVRRAFGPRQGGGRGAGRRCTGPANPTPPAPPPAHLPHPPGRGRQVAALQAAARHERRRRPDRGGRAEEDQALPGGCRRAKRRSGQAPCCRGLVPTPLAAATAQPCRNARRPDPRAPRPRPPPPRPPALRAPPPPPRQVRKGMVLLEAPGAGAAPPRASWEFDAEVGVLTHSTTIAPRYQVGEGARGERGWLGRLRRQKMPVWCCQGVEGGARSSSPPADCGAGSPPLEPPSPNRARAPPPRPSSTVRSSARRPRWWRWTGSACVQVRRASQGPTGRPQAALLSAARLPLWGGGSRRHPPSGRCS
jgi:hypothetical protein